MIPPFSLVGGGGVKTGCPDCLRQPGKRLYPKESWKAPNGVVMREFMKRVDLLLMT